MIKFVEEKEGLGFAEAVELLADRYGVELEREKEDPRAEARRQQRRRLERAARPHRRLLRQLPLGRPTRPARRASTWPSAGWARRCCATSASATRRAPGTRCCVRGQRAGFSGRRAARRRPGPARARGEASTTASARGSCSRSATAAAARSASAAGRCAPTRAPSTSTPPRPTSSTRASMLYGIDLAKAAIAKAGRAVVVEGYTDVLALHQAGIEEAVGVMGTAITERAGGGALGDGRRGGAGARRRLGRPGGDAAGAAGGGRAARCGCGWRRCRRARTRPR